MKAALLRAVVTLSFVLPACADPAFGHLEYRDVSDAPGKVTLGPNSLRFEEGLAVKARVTAIDDDRSPMSDLSLESSDTDVFDVAPGPQPGEWVFLATGSGRATLEVWTDHAHDASLPVEVVAPAAD